MTMVNLPKLSIAAKLYAIFALLATATVVAGAGRGRQRPPSRGADRRVRGRLSGRAERRADQRPDLCRGDGIARHLHVGGCGDRARDTPTGLLKFNDQHRRRRRRLGARGRGRSDAAQFKPFAGRIRQFQRIPQGAGAARRRGQPGRRARVGRQRRQPHRPHGAEQGSRSAGRSCTRTQAREIYAKIDRGIDVTAWLMTHAWRACGPAGGGRRADHLARGGAAARARSPA